MIEANLTINYNDTNWKRDEFIIDSGATSHMCNDKQLFSFIKESQIKRALLPNSQLMKVEGIGSVRIKTKLGYSHENICLENVLLVPELKGNLISCNAVTENKHSVLLKGNKAIITNNRGKRLIMAEKRNGLYIVEMLQKIASANICQNENKDIQEFTNC